MNEFFNIFSSFSSVAEYNAYRAHVEQHRNNSGEEGTSSSFGTDSLREALPSFRERSQASSTSYQGTATASIDSPPSGPTPNHNPRTRCTLDRLGRFLSRSSSTRNSHEPEPPESQHSSPVRAASPEPAPLYAAPRFADSLPQYAPAYSYSPEYERLPPWSSHEPETSYTEPWPRYDHFDTLPYSHIAEDVLPHQPPSRAEADPFQADAWRITDALFGPSIIYPPRPEFFPMPLYQPAPEFHAAPPVAQSVEVPALLNGNALFN